MAENTKKKSNAPLVWTLVILVVLLIFVPLFLMKGSTFGGSDDAGSEEVSQITGSDYTPWFTPVLTQILGVDELPGEIESLFFCIQTGIGVGIVAYCFGYLVARKKYGGMQRIEDEDAKRNGAGGGGDGDGGAGDDGSGDGTEA